MKRIVSTQLEEVVVFFLDKSDVPIKEINLYKKRRNSNLRAVLIRMKRKHSL